MNLWMRDTRVGGDIHKLVTTGLVLSGRRTRLSMKVEINFFLTVQTRLGKTGSSSIFPVDVRSAIEMDLTLFFLRGQMGNSVTPVRRREDTEGDGDAGVKVQIG